MYKLELRHNHRQSAALEASSDQEDLKGPARNLISPNRVSCL